MTKTKRIMSGALALCLTLSLGAFSAVRAEAAEAQPTETAISERATSGGYVRINGRNLFYGEVVVINGVTYVPMFRFASWLGNFQYSYSAKTKTANITGESLKINAKDGTLYIEANGRYFYTGEAVMLYQGEMYVPIKPLVKALNSHISYDTARQAYVVRSGDTRLLKSASQVYNSNDIYWLSRIISAEAEGEPMRGKMAVGNVVLNRMRSKQFPNTIYGVIFDTKYGTQFAPVANGTIYKTPDADSIIAAKMCYEGYSLSSEILYFINPRASTSTWIANNRTFAFAIQNHYFYK